MKRVSPDAPDRITGRLINCHHRAKLIADVLDAVGRGGLDTNGLSDEALMGLGAVAEELADEIEAIEQAIVAEDNQRHEAANGGAR